MNKKLEFLFNPLFYFGLGLFPLFVATGNLKNAVFFAGAVVVELLLCSLIISAFKKLISHYVRIPCYFLVTFAVCYFVDSVFAQVGGALYGDYSFVISLIFVCTLNIFVFDYASTTAVFGKSILSTLYLALSYAITICFMGALREILTFGTIWGAKLGFAGFEFFGTFAGTVLLVLSVGAIYNVIAEIIIRNKRVYNALVKRYLVQLENAFYEEEGGIE